MRWTNRGPALPLIAACISCVLLCLLVFASDFAFLPTTRASSQDKTTQASPSPVASPAAGAARPDQSPEEKQKRAQPEFIVLIDPSHGGDDRGVVFAAKFYEKDVTLALARDLRKELQDRGIPTRMLRDSDTSLSLEHRAEIANEQRGGIYVALHAGLPGRGVRVYSPMLASAAPQTPGKDRFFPWDTAQASSLERSKALAHAVSRELQRKNLDVASLRVPLRPLNNILAPAIAVELTPERGELRSLESARRQNAVASAIASGIAQIRGQMGARP